ncbi:hypothetical protein RHMOL_Rhmol06G0312100 [Rhododendron molle]|uniref:Uncharacterized protein n=1 Tax=Rhododendron molle TaxID=49168 RepID=A0ACC0NKJ2_RHOML|nr:hypothetical protein RHMOL_Rhmol06G0312100 [Rhododendron molle]
MGAAENGGVACKCMRERSLKFNSSSLSGGGGGVFRFLEKRKFRKNLVNVFPIPLLRWELSSSRSVARTNRILSLDAREKSRSRLFVLSKHKRVPIFVMMPIDSFCTDTSGDMKIRKIKALTISLKALKLAGVYGIAVEVWWGIVERTSPFAYNWSLYEELFKLISDSGLKLHIALSFHSNMHLSSAVEGRVSLPLWIVEIGRHNKDIYYQDRNGLSNDDYLTLGVDQHPLFSGRTALQCYEDFMSNFVNKFEALIGTLIEEVSVGLGPCGELRMEDLKMAAYHEGKPQWGNTGPQNAGYYNSFPSEVPFFEEGHDSFLSDYGRFFLEWYSSKLIRHADVILAKAASILEKYQENEQNTLLLVAKIGIIYWWYQTVSHPAELTAGYYNTALRDGYDPLASVLSRHGAALQISCFEIRDNETPETYLCSPERLLQQIRTVSKKKIIHLTGRNSYERFDKVNMILSGNIA